MNMMPSWRQAMQMPQPMSTSGSMFPQRGPGGGWMMPRQAPPSAPAPTPPSAPMAQASAPGNAFMNYWNSPQLGVGMTSLPNIGQAQQQAFMSGQWMPPWMTAPR